LSLQKTVSWQPVPSTINVANGVLAVKAHTAIHNARVEETRKQATVFAAQALVAPSPSLGVTLPFIGPRRTTFASESAWPAANGYPSVGKRREHTPGAGVAEAQGHSDHDDLFAR